MRKFGKQLFALVLTAVIGFASLAPMEAKADSIQSHPDWTKESAVWQVNEGVTAQVRDGILYFDGNGAIPDYTNDTLLSRPWHTSLFGTVMVGKGITDIGTNAFADFKYLRYFYVPSTTFIKDSSAFHKIDDKPVVRIQGSEETTRLIGGKVPYTSLDSWAKIAQSRSYNILYVTDNGTVKNFFRQKTLPNITNVYSADNPNIEHPTSLSDDVGEQLQPFKSPLRFAPGYEMVGRAVTSKLIKVGEDYLNLVAYYLNNVYPEYTYAQSYVNAVSTGDTLYKEFEDTKRYQFQIPANLQSPGRDFKVIVVVGGQPVVQDDLDNSDTTITFATNAGSFNYSIIYK